MKNCDSFLNFAQICLSEAVLTSTHNLCFRAKIRKYVNPCKPQFYYTQQKKFCTSACFGKFCDYIKCYITLFKEIILQQFDAFQTEIQASLAKLCAFKASRGHSSKVVK